MPTVADKTFFQFNDGGEIQVNDIVVGLRQSDLTTNYKFNFPGTGIKDLHGNYLFKYSTSGSLAVNFLDFSNSITTQPALISAAGADANIGISIQPKNNGKLQLDELTWPASDGIPGSVITTNGAGVLSFTTGPMVATATGTAHQIIINGVTGVPVSGNLIFNTPQDIDTVSSPTFSSLTLTNPLTLANGGTSKNLTAANGGIVYTDINSMEILAPTVTARQMLQSGASSAPSWSTSVWPATTTINQILYSSSANTVAGISTANSASLVTNGSGVPAFTSSMTNGQVIIGSTGASPAPATLTAGTGISIANAPSSITINSSGGGSSWTVVTGTSQAMSPDNGYIANNAGLVTLSLPTTCPVGGTLKIMGEGAGGFLISQAAGQQTIIGTSSSTVGVGGSIASTNSGNTIVLVCIIANTTFKCLGAPQGIITVT